MLRVGGHPGRGAFTTGKLEKMTGKLGRTGQAHRPIYYLMPMAHASAACALRENDAFLASTSSSHRKLLKKAKLAPSSQEDVREIKHAVGEVDRKAHACTRKYFIPPSMKEEIERTLELL